MKKIALVSLAALLLLPLTANAHERQQFRVNGEVYEFVIGSVNEPVVVDDKSGFELSVHEVHSAGEADHHATTGGVTGLEETLKVELIAGEKKKVMDISPVYNTPGSYKNTFYPTVATTLAYRIFGTIDGAAIDFTTTCNPVGHASAPEDKSEVKINDQVTRILKTGGFGCPSEKADLGFPENSAALTDLASTAHSGKTWGMTGIGLAALALAFALARRRR